MNIDLCCLYDVILTSTVWYAKYMNNPQGMVIGMQYVGVNDNLLSQNSFQLPNIWHVTMATLVELDTTMARFVTASQVHVFCSTTSLCDGSTWNMDFLDTSSVISTSPKGTSLWHKLQPSLSHFRCRISSKRLCRSPYYICAHTHTHKHISIMGRLCHIMLKNIPIILFHNALTTPYYAHRLVDYASVMWQYSNNIINICYTELLKLFYTLAFGGKGHDSCDHSDVMVAKTGSINTFSSISRGPEERNMWTMWQI